MRFGFVALLALSLTVSFGCRKENGSTSQTQPAAGSSQPAAMTPEQLGELGAQIQKQPENAEKLLSGKGLTRDTYAAEIRRVTEDPEASKRYAAAFRKATE